MSEAIKDLCRRRASVHSSHVEAMRSDDYVAEVSGDTLLAVLLAIDAVEGVASGKDKIVPVEREYICQSCHRRIEDGAREDAGF